MQITHPNHVINTHIHTLICTCHRSLEISHLLHFMVEKQSSAHPRCSLCTPPYATQLERESLALSSLLLLL